MKMIKKISLAAFFLASFAGVQAQSGTGEGGDDGFQVEDIWSTDVSDKEKPEIEVPGVVNPVDTKGLTYKEKEIKVETEYQPLEVPVPPGPKVPATHLYNNFVKLGYGRFASPFASLYLNTGRNLKSNAGLDFTHVSSSKGYVDYAEYRDDYGGVKGEYFVNGHTLRASARFQNTNYYYFADTLLESQPDMKDSLRQTFTKMDVGLSILKNYNPEEVNYDVGLQFQGYFDRFSNQDIHISALPDLDWKITDQFSAEVNGKLTFSNSSFGDVKLSRFFLDLTPMVVYSKDKLTAKAGVKVNSLSDTSSYFGAYPQLSAAYQVLPQKLNISAGLTGQMNYLRYYDLIGENQYLARELDLRPMNDRIKVYIGGDGQLAGNFSWSVQGYWKQVKNQLIYYNPENEAYFHTVYDSLFSQAGAVIGLTYNKNDKIRAGMKGDFRTFKTSTVAYNFNVPNTKVDFWASYNFSNKVYLGAEVFLYGGRVMSMDSLEAEIRQGVVADINLSADYRFNERISVFLQMNNMLNNNWQRWYNYRAKPFDIKGGVTLSF